jgi:ligand-binding sensor domain-containing protein
MRAWVVCLGVVIQLSAALPAHALDGHRRVTQYAQTHFGVRDGMPHGFSDAIIQTADGYLWSASQEGLSRFDGAGFTTYDARKTEGVPTPAAICGSACAIAAWSGSTPASWSPR